jgi:hypothetical protein
MASYFKTAEFWQCAVFFLWSLFELTLLCFFMASVSRAALLLSCLLLVTVAFFLGKAFVSLVRLRLKDPDPTRPLAVRVFIYSTGALAVALQTVLYVIRLR